MNENIAMPAVAKTRARKQRSPRGDTSILLEFALFALRSEGTRQELLDQAALVAAAALGGEMSKVLEHVPAGAEAFLITAGFGWLPEERVVGVMTIPGGPEGSPSGRVEVTGGVAKSRARGGHPPDGDRIPAALARLGVREAMDAAIPRDGPGPPASHGVLQADSRREGAFGRRDESLLLGIAEVLDAALDADDRTTASAESAASVSRLLAAEAEHRIANSLQGVAGTLALQARLNADDPSIAGPLQSAAARIAAAGAVHRQLHRAVAEGAIGREQADIDAAALLHSICRDLDAMLTWQTPASGSRLACEAESFPWPASRAGALATIAAELAINAAKHAPDGRIVMSRHRSAEGEAVLIVHDEGPGFPVETDPPRTRGLGLRLIHALAGPGPGRVTNGAGPIGGRVSVRLARDLP